MTLGFHRRLIDPVPKIAKMVLVHLLHTSSCSRRADTPENRNKREPQKCLETSNENHFTPILEQACASIN